MDELWSDDQDVLTKVVELYESSGEDFEAGEVLEAFPGEQHHAVWQSLRRLSTHGYIETTNFGRSLGDRTARIHRVTGVTERALRAVGAWPDDAELLADRILTVLAEGAENELEPEKRSKLKAGLRGFGGMTREVLVEVLGAALAKSTGAA